MVAFFPPIPNPTVAQNPAVAFPNSPVAPGEDFMQYGGNNPPAQPFAGGKPPIQPLNDISPTSDLGNEGIKNTQLQPGNRLSIEDYLKQIRQLRAQQAAAGVPENQRVVPTFTNIQGGPLDISQGPAAMPPGQAGPGYRKQRKSESRGALRGYG